MFTISDIAHAHKKVKSGRDFPAYIQELKQLGVQDYQTWVKDGHTEYRGDGGYKTVSPQKYDELNISSTANEDRFRERLLVHQQGGSTYPEFCKECAEFGVDSWIVSITDMTCSYYDRLGNQLFVEQIPPRS